MHTAKYQISKTDCFIKIFSCNIFPNCVLVRQASMNCYSNLTLTPFIKRPVSIIRSPISAPVTKSVSMNERGPTWVIGVLNRLWALFPSRWETRGEIQFPDLFTVCDSPRCLCDATSDSRSEHKPIVRSDPTYFDSSWNKGATSVDHNREIERKVEWIKKLVEQFNYLWTGLVIDLNLAH